jgi:GNAT superfamily N-acetyltransferase
MPFAVRLAELTEVDVLQTLIERSVRELQHGDYSPAEIELALEMVYGVDTQLIIDRTYLVAEAVSDAPETDTASHRCLPPRIVGCGGWSRRHTLFGGDQFAGREAALLDPARDAAKIRAFFVHPEWARRGIGSLILAACERAAFDAGFTRLEMGATLTGVAFYHAHGYAERDRFALDLRRGESLAIVRMEKSRPSAAKS